MRRAHLAAFLAALLLLPSASAWAAKRKKKPTPFPVKLTAKVTNRFNWDLKKDNELEDRHFTFTDALVEARYLPGPRFQVVAGEWIQEGQLRPYNMYANYSLDHVNLRVGNQIVRWGKSDEQSPLDNLNPEDLRLGLTRSRADRKIPVPMVNLEFLSDALSLQTVYIPFFDESDIALSGSDWAFFGHLEKKYGPLPIQVEDRPKTLRDGAAGAKLAFTLGSIDFALSALSRRRDLPSLVSFATAPPVTPGQESTLEDVVQFALFTGQPIRLRYQRETVYGFEFETVLGSLGLRGDAMYTSSSSFITDQLQEVRKPVMQYVLGVDYNGPANSYINGSVKQTMIQDYDSRIAFSKKNTTELSGEVQLEFFGANIKPAYRGYFNVTDRSYYQNPKVSVHFIPNITLETGVDIYGGPTHSQLGFFNPNDQVYLTIRYFF